MKISKIIPYLIITITLPSIAQWLNFDTNKLTAVWWTLYFFIILIFIKGRKVYSRGQALPREIRLFIYVVLAEAIYGIFISKGYWDFKTLIGNLFTYLLPLSFFVFSNPKILANTIHKWFRYALIAFFLFIPIMQPEAPAKYLIPIMFVVLFLKAIPARNKLIVLLFFSFIFIYGSLGARASVIKYSIALLMGISFYTGIYKRVSLLKITHFLMMLVPFLFLIYASLNIFNIFKLGDYISGISDLEVKNSYNTSKTEKLGSDTRTFIYVEAFSSAIKNNYIIQGHSLARGYESVSFADTDFYNRGERYDSEVSIINIFTHMGIIGVFLYFLIFFSASNKAINKSNNSYMKMLGIYVSFRWVFAWVEDFSRFDLNYLFLWIMIGMCFSISFRQMTDHEFEQWVKSLFGIKKLV
ncbi:hypothetical protein [Maribellus sediminis]|uniref:hypothetical protein n=1 Tax=Maribellus sediminis TaxID=2696285 RepID=UPI0014313F09|nr:hypothetical protein [Maribellus sediminis]